MDKKMIEKIQKIINLAENAGATEAERDNAMQRAHVLLAKYNLSMSQINAHESDAVEAHMEDAFNMPSSPWARDMLQSIGELYFCDSFYNRRSGGKLKWTYVGKGTNVRVAQSIAGFVVKAVNREAMRQAKKLRGVDYGAACGFETSFRNGASRRVTARCWELKANSKIEAPETGQALVLASVYENEAALAKQYLAKHHPNLRTGKARATTISNRNGMNAGSQFGSSIRLRPSAGSLG